MASTSVRLDRSVATVVVLLGDLAVISLQLAGGLAAHGVDPLADPEYAAETIAPFLVAWLLLAPMLGVYTARVRGSAIETVLSVGIAWIVAALIGAGLRATPWLQGNAPPTFIAVTAAVGLATLLPWRLVVTAASRRLAG